MKNSRNGFTLIELLVVIAIIAILAAILFPVFASAKKRAQTVDCLSNQRQIGMAVQMYLDNNQGKFPNYKSPTPFPWMPFVYVWNCMRPYVKITGMYVCKADAKPAWKYRWANSTKTMYPTLLSSIKFSASYYYIYTFYTLNGVQKARNISEVRFPTKKVIFQCGASSTASSTMSIYAHDPNATALLFVDGHSGLVPLGRLKKDASGYVDLDRSSDLSGSDFQ